MFTGCAHLNVNAGACAVLASGLLVCPHLISGTQEWSLLAERKTLRFIFLFEGD